MENTQKISIGGVKKGRIDGQKIVTANRLERGEVVYLTGDNSWSEDIEEAKIFEGELAINALNEALAQETSIVGPYLTDVEVADRVVTPSGRTWLREKIRIEGPTVPADYSGV